MGARATGPVLLQQLAEISVIDDVATAKVNSCVAGIEGSAPRAELRFADAGSSAVCSHLGRLVTVVRYTFAECSILNRLQLSSYWVCTSYRVWGCNSSLLKFSNYLMAFVENSAET